jgi:methionyl-tRNA formyltransferase
MMRIGIVSNSDLFLPLAYTLAVQNLQVYIYYVHGKDEFVNIKSSEFSKQNRFSFTEEKNTANLYAWINHGKFDACFIIGYHSLIHLEKIDSPDRLFNIHFSLLPAFRGPSPVFWQLKSGEESLGITIHKLNEKFDSGEALWRKAVKNQDFFNYQLALQWLSQQCVEGALFILQMLFNKIPLTLLETSEIVTPSYQSKPKGKDVIIQWENMSANEIYNLIRACNPWNKGAITLYKNQEIKLMDAFIFDLDNKRENLTPGCLLEIGQSLIIQCRNYQAISVNMLYFAESYIPAYQCMHLGLKQYECFITIDKNKLS